MMYNKTVLSLTILLICVLVKSVRGGGAIFVKGNSSAYIRDNIKKDFYKPVTRDLYINPGNFDMVWIEGRQVGDCPQGLNGTQLTICFLGIST